MRQESTPLMPPSAASGKESSKYYFLKKDETHTGGTTTSVRDSDGGLVVEDIPRGSNAEEFAPRALSSPLGTPLQTERKGFPGSSGGDGVGGTNNAAADSSGGGNFWSRLVSSTPSSPGKRKKNNGSNNYGDVGALVKPRKAPIKVEPKVFFANERTFLAWLHLSVILAGASIAILAFADDQNPMSQMYGVMILPVAVAFICYSMHQYARRAYMIRNRLPGPYEDTIGPTVLATMLMLSIIAQFSLKLYAMQDRE